MLILWFTVEWWVVMASVFLVIQVLLKYTHPIQLVAIGLFFGLISRFCLVFFVGPLFAIVHFLVLLGGILVVFVFAVALVPLKITKKGSGLESIGSFSKTFLKFLIFGFLLMRVFSEVGARGFLFLEHRDCVYVSLSWAKCMLILSFYLFLAIIAAADICKNQKGSLIR